MVWPQVSLAQMAALLHPTYKLKIIDANAERMRWPEFTKLIEKYQPKYYFTQLTAPTLENDMYGVFLAKARGCKTIAFGTHITPIPVETLRTFPALDFGLVGEPDLTIRDLLDNLENRVDERPPEIVKLFDKHDLTYQPARSPDGALDMGKIKGLAWRRGDEIVLNFPRPFISDLDDLPIPMHELLPLQKYRMPMMKGPFRSRTQSLRHDKSGRITSWLAAALARASERAAVIIVVGEVVAGGLKREEMVKI